MNKKAKFQSPDLRPVGAKVVSGRGASLMDGTVGHPKGFFYIIAPQSGLGLGYGAGTGRVRGGASVDYHFTIIDVGPGLRGHYLFSV